VCGSRYEAVCAAEAQQARSAASRAASQAGSAFRTAPGSARGSSFREGGGGSSFREGSGGSSTAVAAAALLRTAAYACDEEAEGAVGAALERAAPFLATHFRGGGGARDSSNGYGRDGGNETTAAPADDRAASAGVEAVAKRAHAAPVQVFPLAVLEPWQRRLLAIDDATQLGHANGFIQG
jgi:hypothetical protein